MKITADTAKLKEALKIYARARADKSYPYICNRALQNCAGRAIQLTIKADANRIAWQMGQTATRIGVVNKRKGYRRFKKPQRVFRFDDTLATRMVNTIRIKRGEKPIFGKELEVAAKKFIAYRLRSVAFLRSGWLPAFVGLSRRLDKPLRIENQPHKYGQAKGRYDAATKGTNTGAQAFNTANAIIPHGIDGADKAVAFVAKDLTEWAQKKLVEQARESGLRARVR